MNDMKSLIYIGKKITTVKTWINSGKSHKSLVNINQIV